MAVYNPQDHIPPAFWREGHADVVVSRNERELLRFVWNSPGISRAALTAPMELTQQSLHRIIERLQQRGMIRLDQPESPAGRGPRSPNLSPDRDWCLTVGVAVNVGSIVVALMGFGELIAMRHLGPQSDDLSDDMTRIISVVNDMLADQPDGRARTLGVGLAVSGYFVQDGTLNAPQPLKHWSLTPLAPSLGDALNLPVWVDNGANTAALAEAFFGHGRGTRSFVYIAHNHGYGGGLIVDGRLMRGAFGNSGELSGMFSRDEMPRRPALHLLLDRMRRTRPDLTLNQMLHDLTPDTPGLIEWIDDVTPAHNRAINSISAICDPELIILGGELPGFMGDMLIERTDLHGGTRYGRPRPMLRIATAQVTQSPAATGAALLPLFEMVL
ncbi:ROK family transcriptional regulator [Paracoccus sp. (in: a-proteobacteria)]|uniref:ROK family transcriptional regulator n=1 Tax=Paracoccus sp. TaxID=267 RepID=UPI0026DF2082|nr:ROK family transcriptional regulator [Paracoccus sp. (in: a-proteobacteria)]MDO5647634.1 ROK family transcriptional regulator [Paracoccus sp. (in: a-proteobacteria)]